MIEVQNLVKKYGKHVAVDNLNFTVEKGQVYGFLGPNGAGKSTTMNIMTGYLGATEGDVLIDGISITEEPAKAKSRIGYLPEHPPLYTDMTVSEYLSFVAELKKISPKERHDELEKVVKKTHIDEVRHRLIRNLSKGYRQRVGLAQALMGFPEVIILDEPMVGLDPKQIIDIRSLIRGLAEDHTVILSSHILADIHEICDTIMIISRGKMVAVGSPAELEREMAGGTGLDLTVRCGPEYAAEALTSVSGVTGVDVLPAVEEGAATLRLSCDDDEDIRDAVWGACVSSDMPILMMKRTGMTLEDIFLRLTSEEHMNTLEAEATDAPLEAESDAGEENGKEENDDSDL